MVELSFIILFLNEKKSLRLLLYSFLLMFSEISNSTVFVVDTLLDQLDNDINDGKCLTKSGTCSLRAALSESNFNNNKFKIILPSGVLEISLSGANENNNHMGDFDIYGEIIIEGKGVDSTVINLNGLDRAFDLFSTAKVTLKKLSITGGIDGIHDDVSGLGFGSALNIREMAFAELNQIKFYNNTSEFSEGAVIFQKGQLLSSYTSFENNLNTSAIWIDGPFTHINDCIVKGHNKQLFIVSGFDGFSELEKIIFNSCSFIDNHIKDNTGIMLVGSKVNKISFNNSVITNNSSQSELILNDNFSQLYFNHTTIYGNELFSESSHAVVDVHGPSLPTTYFSNSIVSNNGNVDIQIFGGGVHSLGGNYFGKISDGINQGIVLQKTDLSEPSEPIILSEIIKYNWLKFYRSPIIGSPVIKLGINSGCFEYDQISRKRSYPRCDAGSIEYKQDIIFFSQFE